MVLHRTSENTIEVLEVSPIAYRYQDKDDTKEGQCRKLASDANNCLDMTVQRNMLTKYMLHRQWCAVCQYFQNVYV